MDVVSVNDGKNLGKICDVTFDSEGRISGFSVTGCKGFRLTKSDQFIPFRNIIKIGEDVILVKEQQQKGKPCPPQKGDCPPPKPTCPPDCGPRAPRNFDEYE